MVLVGYKNLADTFVGEAVSALLSLQYHRHFLVGIGGIFEEEAVAVV